MLVLQNAYRELNVDDCRKVPFDKEKLVVPFGQNYVTLSTFSTEKTRLSLPRIQICFGVWQSKPYKEDQGRAYWPTEVGPAWESYLLSLPRFREFMVEKDIGFNRKHRKAFDVWKWEWNGERISGGAFLSAFSLIRQGSAYNRPTRNSFEKLVELGINPDIAFWLCLVAIPLPSGQHWEPNTMAGQHVAVAQFDASLYDIVEWCNVEKERYLEEIWPDRASVYDGGYGFNDLCAARACYPKERPWVMSHTVEYRWRKQNMGSADISRYFKVFKKEKNLMHFLFEDKLIKVGRPLSQASIDSFWNGGYDMALGISTNELIQKAEYIQKLI